MKATMLIGGPEPADGGRLNVIRSVSTPFFSWAFLDEFEYSIHSGMTSGDVKSTFGQSEHTTYKQVVVPLFGKFLKKCYSTFLVYLWAFMAHIPYSC